MSPFLATGGGYRKLKAYKLSEIIYDLSVIFAAKFVRRNSRTRDQIEQAARSGKQNIAEGSKASATSRETEIKLTNVAKASLEELLLDYEDFLRQNSLPQCDKTHPRTEKLRLYVKSEDFLRAPTLHVEHMTAEELCNLCITLINQTTYLLRRLIERQQEQFLQHGGIREQMHNARIHYRTQLQQAHMARTSRTVRTSQTGQTSRTFLSNHANNPNPANPPEDPNLSK